MPALDIDPDSSSVQAVVNSLDKKIRKTASKVKRHGLLRTTRKFATKAFTNILENTQTVSDYFKKAFFYLEREWNELKKTSVRIKNNIFRFVTETRAAKLSTLIAGEQEKIFNKIHGEVDMEFGSIASEARDKTIKEQVINTFRWHSELTGRESEWSGINGIGAMFKRDTTNLIVIYYLYEILCNDIPSFRVFDITSDVNRNETERMITILINKCAEHEPTPPLEDRGYTKPLSKLARPSSRVSPNRPGEKRKLKELSFASAKTSIKEAPEIFRQYKSEILIPSLLAKRSAVNRFKKAQEEKLKKKNKTQKLREHEKALELARDRLEEEKRIAEVEAAGPMPKKPKMDTIRQKPSRQYSIQPQQMDEVEEGEASPVYDPTESSRGNSSRFGRR